jgi:predicted dehydrogenase
VVAVSLTGALTQRLATAAGAGPCTVIASGHSKEDRVVGAGVNRFLAVADGMDAIGAVEAPVVIEATCHADGLATAVAAAAPGGRVVLLGSPRTASSVLPLGTIRSKGLTLVGTHVSSLERELAMGRSNGINGEADAVLEVLENGLLQVGDLFEPDLDPHAAAHFYRRLVDDRSIIGARFDWSGPPASGGRSTPPLRQPTTRTRRPFTSAAGQVRFGMIGCGEIAVLNAEALALAPNTSVTACHDLVPELAADLAGRLGAACSPTVDALLERRDVDAVLLSVPHHLHAPLAIQAAQAGKHIVVEKPPANDLDAAVRMVQAAADAGVMLSICFPQRYEPAAILAKRHIEAIGKPSGVEVRWFADKPPSYIYNGFTGRSPSDWRMWRDQAGGGVLLMNLSHDLELVRYLLQLEAEEVTAVTASLEGNGDVEDHVAVGVRYENGAIGCFTASAAARGLREESLRIWGRDGRIDVKPTPRVYTLRAGLGLRMERPIPLRPRAGTPARARYFSQFAGAVAKGRPPAVTGDDGLRVQALLAAAYRAADTGRAARPDDLLKEAGV